MDYKKVMTASSLMVGTLILAACGNGNANGGDSESNDKVVFNLPAGAEIPKMDGSLATDGESFVALMATQEGLYRQDPDGTYKPALAVEEPTVSEDGKTLTYKLRDAKWSDGSKLTADDFVFAWQRLVNPDTAADYSYLMSGVIKNAEEIMNGEADPEELGVKAVDEQTLEVTLENAVPYLNSLLTMAPFFPLNEAYVTEQGSDYGIDSDHLLFIGPYTMTKWDGTGSSWTYERNPDYWDAENVGADEINIQVIKETSTGINLYESDDLDRVVLTEDFVTQYADNSDFVTEPNSFSYYIKMNYANEALANENIRKAIQYSVDRQAYVDRILQDGSIAIDGFVPHGLAQNPETGEDFRDESGDLAGYDLDQAKEYWEKGLEELGTDSIELELLGDDTDNAKRSSEFLQAQLQDNLTGLKVNLKNVTFKSRLQLNTDGNFELQVTRWGADFADPINYLELFETDNTFNTSQYDNPKFDELIQASREETADLEKRWGYLLEAEKILIQDDAAIAPIYQMYRAAMNKPDIENWTTHTVGADYDYKWITR